MRNRDYSWEYAVRDERARREGFDSYWDKRCHRQAIREAEDLFIEVMREYVRRSRQS